MKKILGIVLMYCGIFLMNSCKQSPSKTQYCRWANNSNRCGIEKDRGLCIVCATNLRCPDLKQGDQINIGIPGGAKDSCWLTLGKKLSEKCEACPVDDTVVTVFNRRLPN